MYRHISFPIQLLLVIGIVFLFGGYIPIYSIQLLYTFSVLFKEILGFILPFIIFSFVLTGILSLKKNATSILLLLVTCIFFSNFFVALAMYGIMSFLLPIMSWSMDAQIMSGSLVLEPLFYISLPQIISSEYALLCAIITGLFFSYMYVEKVETWAHMLKNVLELFLLHCFIPLLPLYVGGFLLKLSYEGIFLKLIQHYSSTFILIIFLQISYLIFFYFVASAFSVKRTYKSMINALPSYLTAFGTMSSTVAVPVSVESAVKNMGHRPLANMAMPIMANVHLLGDSIGTPILAMVTMFLFLGVFPNLTQYCMFVFYFCTTMFAVTGIPGGGILVMIPVLVTTLGFTPEMISVITTLYLLLDSFGTAANVMGDGALIIVVHHLLKKVRLID